jgi:hypothetical protein
MQRDQNFYDLIVQQAWRPAYSRRTDLADSIMTAIVLAPFPEPRGSPILVASESRNVNVSEPCAPS